METPYRRNAKPEDEVESRSWLSSSQRILVLWVALILFFLAFWQLMNG